MPLQPLQDNLELQTYETFERDMPKYAAYERAVHDALLDRVPQSEAATRTTVLMVRARGAGLWQSAGSPVAQHLSLF